MSDSYDFRFLLALGGTALICFLLAKLVLPPPQTHGGLPLPPLSPAPATENFKKKIVQSGLTRIAHVHAQGRLMHERSLRADPEAFKYGTAFRMNRLPLIESQLFIHVTDFKLARTVLLGDKNKGISEGIKKNNLESFNIANRHIGNLFTTTSLDPRREKARKQIAPAFSTTNLLPTMVFLNENIKKVFRFFDEAARSGDTVDMKELCLSLFIETLTKASFDVEFTGGHGAPASTSAVVVDGKAFQDDLDIALRERVRQAMISYRKACFWLADVRRGEEACGRMKKVVEGVLQTYREREESGCLSRDADQSIMHRIMAMHSDIYPSDEYRVSEIISFIIAGHETSAFTLCFFLMEMARHPECRRRLQAALDEAISEECPSHGLVSKVEYLSWCIKESMRLWPVAGSGSVRTLEEDIKYNGMVLPKGAAVQTVFYSIFRASWIDRADEFIPERWSEDNPQIQDLKDMFMPFSLGKRGCVGQNMATMQLRVIAANFMRFYDFELTEEVRFEHFLTIKPDNLTMKLKRRQ